MIYFLRNSLMGVYEESQLLGRTILLFGDTQNTFCGLSLMLASLIYNPFYQVFLKVEKQFPVAFIIIVNDTAPASGVPKLRSA